MSDDIDILAQERVGTCLNEKWTLERLLGVGGMAAVYSARHRNGARAAIKVLHQSLSRHEEVRERFLREGYAANKVEHPGAVKVLDDDVIKDGADEGTAFIVMELLEGESLQDRLERGPPLTEREFLAVAEDVLGVLEAAHGRGVVHRDLKPENLFLMSPPSSGSSAGDAPRVKVLDFGLARLLDGQTITSHGLALGTPSFMSPEQAAGRISEIDGRTDLFALGATGFRVRTGRRIHEGVNAIELVGKMANIAAPPIRRLSPEVSEPYARVIDKALEFRREDRYAHAAAMREDVRRAIAELDGDALTVRASVPPLSQKPPSVRPPPPLPPTPSPSSSIAVAHPGREASKNVTVELSGSDLQSLPVVTPAPRRRRRLALLPWVTLVVLGAIGGKLWLDHRAVPASEAMAAQPPAASTPTATSTSTSTPTSTTTATTTSTSTSTSTNPAPSAVASETSEEPAEPQAVAAIPPAPVAPRINPTPPSVATHRRPPPKVGPGNVHKLPGKHHNKPAR